MFPLESFSRIQLPIFSFQTKSRNPSPPSRGNPKLSNQKKNFANNSPSGGDIDPAQFAKILELLTNPKLKKILKPEVADTLEDNLSLFQNSGQDQNEPETPRTENKGVRRVIQRPRGPVNSAAGPRAIKPGRKIPLNRRNKFTSRFIPKVRPVGELDNISENAFVAPKDEVDSVFTAEEEILEIQDDLVTSTTESLLSKVTQPLVVKEEEVPQEQQVENPAGRPFRRFNLRRRPGTRNNFRPSRVRDQQVQPEQDSNSQQLENLGEKMIKDILEGNAKGGPEVPEGFRENFSDFLSEFRKSSLLSS